MVDAVTRRLKIPFFVALVVVLLSLTGSGSREAQARTDGPIASAALSHLGGHGGQCWTFMRKVVKEATGRNVGFDYRLGYFEAGAIEVSADEAANGDIIQIAADHNTNATASYPGLHTAIVLENLGNGVFNAIDSNQDWDEMVQLRPKYEPYKAAARYGLQVHIYRIPGGSTGAAAAKAEVGLGSAVVSTDGCLNLRANPSTSGKKLDCLPAGTGVTVISETVAAEGLTWVKVTAKGTSGWVAANYLSQAAAAPAPGPEPEPEAEPEADTAAAGNDEDGPYAGRVDPSPGCLVVRSGPAKSAGVLSCEEPNTPILVLSLDYILESGFAWMRVRTQGGVEGWAAGNFILLDKDR